MAINFLKVELARTGTFEASTGQVTFTRDDWDEAVRASVALRESLDPPIKLGHAEDQLFLQEDGLPSAGFVRNLRRDGDTLVADLIDVPDQVAALVKSGRLAKRSIEAVRNLEIAGKRWPFVLTGLAFLGADLPAVSGLADIAKLYASSGLTEIAVEAGETAVYVYQTKQIRAAGTPGEREGDPTMNEKLLKLARTMLKLAEGATESEVLTALKLEAAADEDAVYAALGSYKAPDPDPTAEELAAAKATKEKAEAEAAAVLASKSDLEKLRLEMVELKTERGAERAAVTVDGAIKAGKFAPAAREQMIKLAADSPAAFEEMVEAAPEGTVIPQDEKGSSSDGGTEVEILAEFKLSDTERTFCELEGLDQDAFIAERIRAAGKTVPEKLAAKLAKAGEERIKAAEKTRATAAI